MANTKQKLIDTAFELFGRNGFHAIGLDRIIEDVGVSKQTFYNHFESKDDLIIEVLKHRHRIQSAMVDDLMTQLAGRDPRARLESIFDVIEAWMNKPDWRGCIFMTAAAEFPTPNEPAHQLAAEHTREMVEYLQYLATLSGATDPKALAEQVALLVDGAIAYRHVTCDPRAIEVAKQLAKPLFERYLPQQPTERAATAPRKDVALV